METVLLVLVAVIMILFLYSLILTYKFFSQKEQLSSYEETYNDKINRKITDIRNRLNEVKKRDISYIDVDIDEELGHLED